MDDKKRAYVGLGGALHELQVTKPNDRSGDDRVWAVTITEIEKALAYFAYMIPQPRVEEGEQ